MNLGRDNQLSKNSVQKCILSSIFSSSNYHSKGLKGMSYVIRDLLVCDPPFKDESEVPALIGVDKLIGVSNEPSLLSIKGNKMN